MSYHSTTTFLAMLAFCAGACAAAAETTRPAATRPAEPFKLIGVFVLLDEHDMPIQMRRMEAYFLGDQAVMIDKMGLPERIFDFNRRTLSDNRGRMVALADLQKQAAERRDKALADLAKQPESKASSRMRQLLAPHPTITVDGTNLTVRSEVFETTVVMQAAPKSVCEQMLLVNQMLALDNWDIANPPFTNLLLSEELTRRGCYAKTARILAGSEEQSIRLDCKTALVPLTPDELKRFAAVINATKPTTEIAPATGSR